MVWDQFRESNAYKKYIKGDPEIFDISAVERVFPEIMGEAASFKKRVEIFDCITNRNMEMPLTKQLWENIRLPFNLTAFTFTSEPDAHLGHPGRENYIICAEEFEVTKCKYLLWRGKYIDIKLTFFMKNDLVGDYFVINQVNLLFNNKGGLIKTNSVLYDTPDLFFKTYRDAPWDCFNYKLPSEDLTQEDKDNNESWAQYVGEQLGITSGVLNVLLVALQLLQCSNVEKIKIIAPESINKHRVKRGQNCIDSYYILKIPGDYSRHSHESAHDYNVRLHKCRGHFKRVNNLFGRGINGSFWWRPQLRGNKGLGIITKEYKVGIPKNGGEHVCANS